MRSSWSTSYPSASSNASTRCWDVRRTILTAIQSRPPRGDCPTHQHDSLLTCPVGTPLRITRITDQDPAFLRFVERNDLKPGQLVEVESSAMPPPTR